MPGRSNKLPTRTSYLGVPRDEDPAPTPRDHYIRILEGMVEDTERLHESERTAIRWALIVLARHGVERSI